MDTVKLHEALGEASRGLNEISTQFEALQLRKQQLESVVASLSALLGEPLPDQISSLPPAVPVPEHSYKSEEGSKSDLPPQWKMAEDLLLEVNRPMTVPEMLERLAVTGVKVQGDGLRVAMLRKPKIFTNPAYGLYALKAWKPVPPEKEEEEGFSFEKEHETAAA